MKTIERIKNSLNKSINNLSKNIDVQVEKSRGDGDFSTNVAMILSKELKINPMDVAKQIVGKLDKDIFEKVEIAKPGFINMYISPNSFVEIITAVNKEREDFGRANQGKYLNVEYVSANPTGHLHAGHARGAVYGSALINILKFAGNKVDSEYYVNDAGNQIDILGNSVFLRYQELLGKEIVMPEDSYKGAEIIDVAKTFVDEFGDSYLNDKYEDVSKIFKSKSKTILLEVIKEHLELLDIKIDKYTSEEDLINSGEVQKTLDGLKDFTYEKEGATWIKSSKKGDDKDRVVIRSDGFHSYLGSDIANHKLKIEKKYDKLINVWGADHVGQVKRLQASIEFLGHENILDIQMVQLVKLMKNGKELKMSKRSGTAYRLIDLVEEFGKDSSRWYMISKSSDSQFVIDINKIKDNWKESALYIVQYAHARANQLILKSTSAVPSELSFSEKEKKLLMIISEFPKLIETISNTHKVHLLPTYLLELSKTFNSWYTNNKVIGNENEYSFIELTKASKQIISNGLAILGIEAPEQMSKN